MVFKVNNVNMMNDHVNSILVGIMVSISLIISYQIYLYLGTCNETSKTTFECFCQEGWIGEHCENMLNLCENVTCLNNGICRRSFLNYTCECLGENYSGRHCENVATSRVVLQTVTKSLGYIALIFLSIVISFFVIMDVLKYVFGIDPVKDERERIRRLKAMKRMRKHRPIIQKFTYVNEPSPIATVDVEE